MRVKIHQRTIVGKIVIRGINTKVGIGDSRTRHVNAVNYLLEEVGGAVVGVDVVNDEELDGGKRKAKHTAYLNKRNQPVT